MVRGGLGARWGGVEARGGSWTALCTLAPPARTHAPASLRRPLPLPPSLHDGAGGNAGLKELILAVKEYQKANATCITLADLFTLGSSVAVEAAGGARGREHRLGAPPRGPAHLAACSSVQLSVLSH